MSSTCFETEGSSAGRWLYVQLWCNMFYMHQTTYNAARKTYYNCMYYRLAEDELSVSKRVDDIKN